MIEQAYTEGAALGVAIGCQDEAGPFQTMPYPGSSWQPEGHPARRSHEYVREGTAKLLTLFHPATGRVQVKGVTSTTNAILHAWLKEAVTALLAELPPPPPVTDPVANRACWTRWQEGLSRKITLPAELPALRLLLIWDNLIGHRTPELVLWLFAHGVMVLYTPLSGSWLNMAESIQRILEAAGSRRAAPADPSGDHRLARSDRSRLERRSDALRVGRQARRPPSTRPPAAPGAPGAPRAWWLGGLHLSPTASPQEGRLAWAA